MTIQAGILAVLIFQSIIFAVQLLIIFWQFWLRIPRVKCRVHDAHDQFTKKGLWRFKDRQPFPSPEPYAGFGLFLTNKSASPAYIVRIKVNGRYDNVWILNEKDEIPPLPGGSIHIIGSSLRLYQPFSLEPFEHRIIILILETKDVNVETLTEITIEMARGRNHKLFVQGVVKPQEKTNPE